MLVLHGLNFQFILCSGMEKTKQDWRSCSYKVKLQDLYCACYRLAGSTLLVTN